MISITKEILSNFLQFLINDWRHDRALFFIENIGTVLGLIAATLIAAFTTQAPFFTIYLFFTFCSLLLIVAAYKRNSSPVVVLNTGYLFINVYGLLQAIPGVL